MNTRYLVSESTSSSELLQDLDAFKNENQLLQHELQKLTKISSELGHRVNELEAEIELINYEIEFDESSNSLTNQSDWDLCYKDSPSPMLIIDNHAIIMDCNDSFLNLVSEVSHDPVNKNFRSFLNKVSRYDFIKFIKKLGSSINKLANNEVLHFTSGTSFTFLIKPVAGEINDSTIHYLMLINLVDFVSLSKNSLQLSNAIIEQMHEGLMVTDHEGRIVKVNQAFIEITGFNHDDVLNATPKILHSGRHSPAFYDRMWREIEHHGWWAGEVWNKRKSGEIFPEWLQISRIHDKFTGKFFYVALFSDITERKAHQTQLDRLAFYDALTSLPNRQLLNQSLEACLHYMQATPEYQIALIFIDLDKFKNINDTFGHAEGDRVLKEAAQRIISLISDSDMASRIGGDEFVLLIKENASRDSVMVLAKDLLRVLEQPFITNKSRHHLSASLGVAFAPLHGDNVEDLMRRADAAMYSAKHEGRNKFKFFSFEHEASMLKSNITLNYVRHALASPQEHLNMAYQPIFSIHDQQTAAHYEALLRPKNGDIYVSHFIELAEQHGLISELGLIIFRLICRDISRLSEARRSQIKVTVNLSVIQFFDLKLCDKLQSIAAEHGLNLDRFYFEVTETATMQNLEQVRRHLIQLQSMGAKIMLDDFGTGYASLSMLRDLPIDVLKIDRSFVMDIGKHVSSQLLISAMLAMARAFNLQVVAEGVETQEQFDWLKDQGVNYIQGYLLGRPDIGFA
ncbi:diguanylate cyclase [Thiomicrospira aerophila AL3]|uniref:Diguanylate cyclase n=2 Tax=Thiomicrospira aerophila TaxID=92245 RepID=W0DWW8_9GAMM|nr:diguanylate cyclase [Thiomicrospira aerophila AL3]